MNSAALSQLAGGITEAGLAGKSETAMLDGFCRRANAAGLPVARATVIIDTLHPVHEGRATRWRREGQVGHTELIEYGSSSEGEMAEIWRRSPFFQLLETGGSQLRIRLAAGEAAEFPTVVALQDEGMTDYLALINRFAAHGVIGEMDWVYSSWATAPWRSSPRRRRAKRAAARSKPKPRCASGSTNSTSAGAGRTCRPPTSISGCMSARCSTAISAARTGSTSPWSARRSTRSA